MPQTFSQLYNFNVVIEEVEKEQGNYRLNVLFSGDDEFYNRLISVAKTDSVLLTCRTLPFMMRLLHQQKYLFYFEQPSKKKSNHLQWRMENILRREEGTLLFNNIEFAQIVQNELFLHLNLFAREEAKKMSKLKKN